MDMHSYFAFLPKKHAADCSLDSLRTGPGSKASPCLPQPADGFMTTNVQSVSQPNSDKADRLVDGAVGRQHLGTSDSQPVVPVSSDTDNRTPNDAAKRANPTASHNSSASAHRPSDDATPSSSLNAQGTQPELQGSNSPDSGIAATPVASLSKTPSKNAAKKAGRQTAHKTQGRLPGQLDDQVIIALLKRESLIAWAHQQALQNRIDMHQRQLDHSETALAHVGCFCHLRNAVLFLLLCHVVLLAEVQCLSCRVHSERSTAI